MTEQRHLKTWNLSQVLATNTAEGLRQILSVDQDISERLIAITDKRESEVLGKLERLSEAIKEAFVTAGSKIYLNGCGASGRLAKQIESETWLSYCSSLR